MIQLRNGRELAILLRKAMEIERGFENMAQWEGYIQARNGVFRDTLFQMISESENHSSIVAGMIDRLAVPLDDMPSLRAQTFDFTGKEDMEVMRMLGEKERLAFDTYSNIRSAIMTSDTSNWMSIEAREHILSGLSTLVEEEAEHMRLATSAVGKVERIR